MALRVPSGKSIDIASKIMSIFRPSQVPDHEKFNMNYMKSYSYNLLQKWKKFDNIICVFSIIGYIISLTEYEMSFSDERTYKNCKNSQNDILRWFTMLTSISASFFVYLRYRVQASFYDFQAKNAYKQHFRYMFERKSFLAVIMIFEIVILWIFPLPHTKLKIYFNQLYQKQDDFGDLFSSHDYSICYTYAELAFIAMVLRFYFILKFILNSSSYRDMFSTYYCNKYNTRAGFRFAFKSLLLKYEYKVLIIVLSSLFLLSENLRVFERPFTDVSGQNFESYQNCMWCLFITMTTIGYGDIYPATYGGKITCILSTFWAGFSLSWVMIYLTSSLELSPDEEKTLKKIEKSQRDRLYDLDPVESFKSSVMKPRDPENIKDLAIRLSIIEEKLDEFLNLNN